jgi:hypothetical protein
MVDIDGVISLFGPFFRALEASGAFAGGAAYPLEGSFHSIDGIPHFLSSTAARHLLDLSELFDVVWASGWEEKAEEHLPHLLGLPARLPFLRFPRQAGALRSANAHWKLAAIEAFAGPRPLAWIDDSMNEACREWARDRSSPTLLVETSPARLLPDMFCWGAPRRPRELLVLDRRLVGDLELR